MKRTPFDDLPFLPYIIAETIAQRPYEMQEYGEGGRTPRHIAYIEAKRQALSPEQIHLFAEWCERRCRKAYELKANWFLKCVKAKGNAGRNHLYTYLTHWMVAYLENPPIALLDSPMTPN